MICRYYCVNGSAEQGTSRPEPIPHHEPKALTPFSSSNALSSFPELENTEVSNRRATEEWTTQEYKNHTRAAHLALTPSCFSTNQLLNNCACFSPWQTSQPNPSDRLSVWAAAGWSLSHPGLPSLRDAVGDLWNMFQEVWCHPRSFPNQPLGNRHVPCPGSSWNLQGHLRPKDSTGGFHHLIPCF